MYKTFSNSSIGESHIKSGKQCQDYSIHYSSRDEEFHIIALADGHGGDKYFRSQKGSEYACKAAKECAIKCMREKSFTERMIGLIDENGSEKEIDSLLIQLEKSIIGAWSKKVLEDIEENEFNDDELNVYDEEKREHVKNTDYGTKAYGTTLIMAVICDKFWFGLHIGDGTFVTVSNEGFFSNPIELDEKCVGNFVTSICDNDAINLFHHSYGNEKLKAIFIASDGVDESFISGESFHNFYRSIIKETEEDFNSAIKDLKVFLPTLGKKGSQDDVSLAGIIEITKNANEKQVKNDV